MRNRIGRVVFVGLSVLTGCLGGTNTITLDAKTARLDFGVVAVELGAGNGEIVDFCVVLDDSICGFPGGEALGCGLDVSTSEVTVYCSDPLLAEWPTSWTLLDATWSAPSVPASGTVLVESAQNYLLPPGATIVTDPGYSAYIVRLNLDSDFGPADVDFTFRFDHGGEVQDVVVKAVEVLVAEVHSALQEKVIVPLGDSVIDFPNLPSENTLEIVEPAPTLRSTWGRIKARFGGE